MNQKDKNDTVAKKRPISNGIKYWPKSERPREMLLEKGPEYVSDAGLIAVLLRYGTTGKDAVSLSRELIKQFGGLRGLLNATQTDLKKIKGLGPAKIAQLMAAIEIVKRQLKEDLVGKDYVKSADDVVKYLTLKLQDVKKEFFKVIYLDNGNAILSIEELSHGTIDQTHIYPREIIKKAFEIHARALIVVHNHPSGNFQPSHYDREVTRKLILACEAVDIKILDHLIISPEGYFSFQREGLMSV